MASFSMTVFFILLGIGMVMKKFGGSICKFGLENRDAIWRIFRR